MSSDFGGSCVYHGYWSGTINCPACMAGTVAVNHDEIDHLKATIRAEQAKTMWWKAAAFYSLVGLAVIAFVDVLVLLHR